MLQISIKKKSCNIMRINKFHNFGKNFEKIHENFQGSIRYYERSHWFRDDDPALSRLNYTKK